MVVWEGGAQKGGHGGGTLVDSGHPCPLTPRYRQPSAGVSKGAALAGAQSATAGATSPSLSAATLMVPGCTSRANKTLRF